MNGITVNAEMAYSIGGLIFADIELIRSGLSKIHDASTPSRKEALLIAIENAVSE